MMSLKVLSSPDKELSPYYHRQHHKLLVGNFSRCDIVLNDPLLLSWGKSKIYFSLELHSETEVMLEAFIPMHYNSLALEKGQILLKKNDLLKIGDTSFLLENFDWKSSDSVEKMSLSALTNLSPDLQDFYNLLSQEILSYEKITNKTGIHVSK